MGWSAGAGLVGRGDELGALVARLDDVGRGVVATGLVGDTGTGRTALLDEVRRQAEARGFTVLVARGAEAETPFSFAGLHQLVRSLLGGVDQLPSQQRDALLACFGLGEPVEVTPFFVALATLELLVEAASVAPVLVCLDDVDLMDQASVEVLTFVVRRLAGEQVVVVCTSRRPMDSFGDAQTVTWATLGPLDAEASLELLRSRSPRLTSSTEERVLRQAAGNPLAIVELSTTVHPGQHPWVELDDDLPMTDRLEKAFIARADRLDSASRVLVDVASVDDGGSLTDVLTAASIVHGSPVDDDAAHHAVELGLLQVAGDRYRIANPLVGSALRQAMSPTRRRAAHAALAQVIAGDHERALWHRAAAVQGYDEQVAAELERAAVGARRRGAATTAVVWLERAAALSPAPEARTSRLLGAAEIAYELGRFGHVDEIKSRVAAMPLSARDRSRLTWLDGAFHDGSSSEPSEIRRLVGLSRDADADGDTDLAAQMLFGAARRVWWRDPGDSVRAEIVHAARQLPLPARDPRLLAILALGESLEVEAMVVDQLDGWPADADGRPDLAGLLGISAFCVGEFKRAITFLSTAVDALRAQGRLGLLAEALAIRSWAEINLGVFDPSRSADEAMRLADETGQAVWAACGRIAIALSDGVAGRWDPRHVLLAEAEQTAVQTPNASSSLLAAVQQTRGMAELSADRPEHAYGELHRIFVTSDPAHQRVQQLWALGYLADAGVRTGRRDSVRRLLDSSERLTSSAGAGSAVAREYARAVLAEDDEAEQLFQAALEGAAAPFPWHRARLELAQGSWLRRQRRVLESREPLRAARGTFAAIGAVAWAERADQELRAAGEAGPWLGSSPLDDLSPQESRIAELAAQGLSNREIGEQLFLSHRTVGSHLYRIFPKLGITSRNQLAGALSQRPD